MTKKTQKKLTGKAIQQLVVIALLLCLLVYVAFFMGEEPESSSTKQTKAVAVETKIGNQNATQMTNFANVPKRFEHGPTYDEIVMEAKLRKQAIDQTETDHFIKLELSRRNKVALAEIARLDAQIAESKAKIVSISNGNKSTGGESNTFSFSNEQPTSGIVSYDEYGVEQSSRSLDVIRLIGWSGSNQITASMNGEETASRLKMNQVIFGRYKIEGINTDLKCIKLSDARTAKSIPDVCYN